MRTEITIPVAFDTTPLEEKLQRDGEAEVERVIREIVTTGVRRALPTKYTDTYGRTLNDPEIAWGRYVGERLRSWLDDHAEEIIDEAALLLASRGAKRKTWKQVLAELKEEEQDGQAD